MSFKAQLKVGGNEYNVLNCSYELHQETDATMMAIFILGGRRNRIVGRAVEGYPGVGMSIARFCVFIVCRDAFHGSGRRVG